MSVTKPYNKIRFTFGCLLASFFIIIGLPLSVVSAEVTIAGHSHGFVCPVDDYSNWKQSRQAAGLTTNRSLYNRNKNHCSDNGQPITSYDPNNLDLLTQETFDSFFPGKPEPVKPENEDGGNGDTGGDGSSHGPAGKRLIVSGYTTSVSSRGLSPAEQQAVRQRFPYGVPVEMEFVIPDAALNDRMWPTTYVSSSATGTVRMRLGFSGALAVWTARQYGSILVRDGLSFDRFNTRITANTSADGPRLFGMDFNRMSIGLAESSGNVFSTDSIPAAGSINLLDFQIRDASFTLIEKNNFARYLSVNINPVYISWEN